MRAISGPIERRLADTPVSFEDLFRDEFARVSRSVMLLLHDADLSQEIAQEAFARLLVRWTSMASTQHARNFVFRVAINLSRSHLRRAARTVPSEAATGELSTRDEIQRVDDRAVLTSALARLSPRQRWCVVLVDYADLDVGSVAGILHLRPNTVYVHLSRARERLRGVLRPQDAGKEHDHG